MIAAVIVTYNRKKLLAENIEMMLQQKVKADRIYIVDNCSTDGTYDYLRELGWTDLSWFRYIKTESNIGGAGGFYTGSKAAYEDGADWVILMDDDGKPTDTETIGNLMDVAQSYYDNGKKMLFINALVHLGELLSFKIDDMYTVAEALEEAKDNILLNAANPFNGTVVSRELISEIGFPNKAFFIKGDEVNYKQRAYDAGAIVATVISARYTHPRPETFERIILGKKVPFFVEAPWKEYYAARNFTYMYKEKGWYKAIAFELIFVKLLAILSMKCSKYLTIKMMIRGVVDGWRNELGPTIKP